MGNGMRVGSEMKPKTADQVIDFLVDFMQLRLDPFQGAEQRSVGRSCSGLFACHQANEGWLGI